MTAPVAGVDGARGQWLVARMGTGAVGFDLVPTFADVHAVAEHIGAACVGVDMPIGLPTDGPRDADIEARRRLGARSSTLFPTPAAATVDAVDYVDACERSRRATGKALSKQAWNLMPMIRDLRSTIVAAEADRFIEVHPESTFCALAGEPLPPKKTAAGVGARLALVRPHLAALGTDLDDVLASAPDGVAVDDALDALAAAIGARRFVEGHAEVLGSGVDPDGFPLRLVI